jgi:uracil-DNA glycosylase
VDPVNVKIEESWKEVLHDEFEKSYFQQIKDTLIQEKEKGKIVYPRGPLIFNAFNQTPFDQVKVVIIGQDPYHNPNEAIGLCFSVPRGVRIPPSLKNVFKEIHRDLDIEIPHHGDLSSWASQGVFLLNAMLTVRKNEAGSHKNIGWQTFTDAVIKKLSDQRLNLIFLLWGNFAQSKAQFIDSQKHHILPAAHPSPLARNAFSGCAHFSKTNEILIQNGQSPIDWSIDS